MARRRERVLWSDVVQLRPRRLATTALVQSGSSAFLKGQAMDVAELLIVAGKSAVLLAGIWMAGALIYVGSLKER